MTMTKTKTIERTKTTRRYDSVSKKVRKLLSATAQTFIPELCEALAKDWYPELELHQIKNDSNARNEIRNRMFMDWGDENKVLSDNLWKDSTINLYFPDWLRNPMRQSDSITEHL